MDFSFSIFPKADGFARIVRSFEQKPFPAAAEVFRTTVQVGSIRYRQCASIYVDTSGLFIRIKYIFKNFPTTFIPWSSLKESKKSTLYGLGAIQFDFVNQSLPSIVFYEKDLQGYNFTASSQ